MLLRRGSGRRRRRPRSAVTRCPRRITLGATTLTRGGWGSIPRTYVTCAQDMAIRPAVQRRFITEADAAFPDNVTSVVALDASHSPFLSMPDQVADLVTKLG
ncbi:alpha/beta fold hydrolase [Streptomyces sp. NPDC058067]|uniref:alpha/beta fold hydrolase n=1 Tax=Streptomyces sp. NPDC058067 TaxID=3346324 RepID=UPI0036EAD5F1